MKIAGRRASANRREHGGWHVRHVREHGGCQRRVGALAAFFTIKQLDRHQDREDDDNRATGEIVSSAVAPRRGRGRSTSRRFARWRLVATTGLSRGCPSRSSGRVAF